MARLLQQFVEPVDPCPYLGDRTASLETRILLDVSSRELEAMLVRGWRRFGPSYFRPACEPCGACVPIRIPTATFAPSKSQRRARKACASLRVVAGPPRVDRERLDLYRAWHSMREDTRGWHPAPLDARGYEMQFAFPHPSGLELAYYETREDGTQKLVGLGICDQTPSCLSAVYFFYDPAWRDRSLGVFNVLHQVEYARTLKLPHVYLGFRILECPSMRYKSTFRPHELLLGRPSFLEQPVWVPSEQHPSNALRALEPTEE